MAHQVLDRNGATADLSNVNFGNWQKVIRVVNNAVEKRVLMVKSEPNRYRLTERGIEAIRDSM
jgi:predicted transcriptional regulator